MSSVFAFAVTALAAHGAPGAPCALYDGDGASPVFMLLTALLVVATVAFLLIRQRSR